MRKEQLFNAGIFIVVLTIAPSVLGQAGIFQTPPANLGTQVLSASDGWASTAPGTTGGSTAIAANIKTVSTFAQLQSALSGTTAKIIHVSGHIYGMVDANNARQPCSFYQRNGYTQTAYNTAFDPATYGFKAVSGPLETARVASANAQKPSVVLAVPANTTLVGDGNDATLENINLTVSAANVIIRNITFRDAYDCFPQWGGTDQNPVSPPYIAANNTTPGNWNSAYDNLSLTGATRVWVDHCTFTDEPNTEASLPYYFGRPFMVHDGELDITNGSDLVTVSWNVFKEHSKTSLNGSSDTASGDNGKIRSTFHHNYFYNVEERVPRDRFGKIDVYDNFYDISNFGYVYSWGVGVNSAIFAENNAFITSGVQSTLTPDRIIYPWKGTVICVAGTRFNDPDSVVDVLPLANAAFQLWSPVTPGVPLSGSCGWTPTLRVAAADSAKDVPALVVGGAPAHPSVAAAQDFGTLFLGCDATSTITLSNTAGGPLYMGKITATGDFSISSDNCGPSLAAGSSCDISVKFTPTTQGSRQGTLSISDWALTSPQTVSLSGNAVANAPALSVPADSEAATGESCQVAVPDYAGGSSATEDCSAPGSIVITQTPAAGVLVGLGMTDVTVTATDAAHTATSKVVHFHVIDTTAPVPNLATLSTLSGECSVTIAAAPTASDNCANTITGTTTDPLSYTTQGTFTVTWHYLDGSNNSSTQTQSVVVHDSTAPVPNVPTLSDITGECSATILAAPTATDNCAGMITGTTTDPLTYTSQGTFTVNWHYNDGNGNQSTQTQKVVVHDSSPPVPNVALLPIINGECSATIPAAPTATDNCSGTITGTTSDSLTRNIQGTSIVTWTFNDGHGNSVTQTQKIVVSDTTAPVPNQASLPDVVGVCAATVAATPAATDNCAGAIAGTTSDPLTYTAQGTFYVHWNYNDGHGNISTQAQRVIVLDAIPPTLTLNGNSISLWPANHNYQTVAVGDLVATAIDNCDSSLNLNSVTIAQVSSDEGSAGSGDIILAADCKSVQLRADRNGNGDGRVYTLTFRVRDVNGNTSEAVARVVVPHDQGHPNAVDSGPAYTVAGACP